MRVTCISDLHGFYPKLESGDLLLIAGDLTGRDHPNEHADFIEWLDVQPFKMKIVIAGNHDKNIDIDAIHSLSTARYLQDSGYEFTVEEDDIEMERSGMHPTVERTFKIWGSPWTLAFEGINPICKEFTVDTDEQLNEKWNLIHPETDILVTHCPPFHILDSMQKMKGTYEGRPIFESMRTGSKSLLDNILKSKRRMLHCFGHIHEGYGKVDNLWGGWSVNASIMNRVYEPINKPIVIEL